MKRIFIKLPVPGSKTATEYVAVDPARLHPGVLAELFERVPNPGRGKSASRYMPISGSEFIVQDSLDVTPLAETLREILAQYEAVFCSGEAGQRVWDELIQKLDFMALIQALAKGKVESADRALQNLLYKLLSEVAELAEQQSKDGAALSSTLEVIDRYDETLAQTQNITDGFYTDWAQAADMLADRVEILTELEQELREFRELIQDEIQDWRTTVANPGNMSALKGFFEGDANQDGFLITAFLYQQDPASRPREEIEELIAEARRMITLQREYERNAQADWNKSVATAREDMIQKHPLVQRIVREIEDASRRMRDHEQRWGSETLRPYQIKRDGSPLISREQYERAREHLEARKWAPMECRTRIRTLLSAVIDMMNQEPTLPSEIKELFEQAENRITDIEQSWESEEAGVADSEPDEGEETGAEDPGEAGDRNREDELYEFVICVAFVLTCNHHFLAQSTISALLDTVRYLGRCTEAEVLKHKAVLTRRSQNEMCVIGKGKKLKPYWLKSDQRWIRYRFNKKKGRWGLKLGAKQESLAKQLMSRHGLTEKAIREAHERRREFKAEQFNKRNRTSK